MEKSQNLPSIEIDGKSYVPVHERLRFLSDHIRDYSIETSYQHLKDENMWIVSAKLTIYKDGKALVYTGTAGKKEASLSADMQLSALEYTETTAVGRACAMAGIGIRDGVASANEMATVTPKQSPSQKHVEKSVEQKEDKNGVKMATVKQKSQLLLLANQLTEEEKNKLILEINTYTEKKADQVYKYVQKVIKERKEKEKVEA